MIDFASLAVLLTLLARVLGNDDLRNAAMICWVALLVLVVAA